MSIVVAACAQSSTAQPAPSATLSRPVAAVAYPSRSRCVHHAHRRRSARNRRHRWRDAGRQGHLQQGLRPRQHRDKTAGHAPTRSSPSDRSPSSSPARWRCSWSRKASSRSTIACRAIAPTSDTRNEITLRDLGNHVSGYRDYYPLDFVDRPMAKDIAEEDLLNQFTAQAARLRAGLALLLQQHRLPAARQHRRRSSGRKPFDQSLQERIFTPLGMTRTRDSSRRAARLDSRRATRRSASVPPSRRSPRAAAGSAPPAASGRRPTI